MNVENIISVFLHSTIKNAPILFSNGHKTIDGFIAPEKTTERAPVWITNSYSRQLVHKWRAEEQAILVGNKTVIEDNPKLTIRDWSGKNPVRIVIDLYNKIPKGSSILDKTVKTIVITTKDYKQYNEDTFLIYEMINSENNIPEQICNILHTHEIQSVIIEGGSYTIQSFINENLWDEARVFTGMNSFVKGVKAPKFQSKLVSEKKIIDDTLRMYYND